MFRITAENKLFNRGIASGEAFCNRTDEIERLLKNIQHHTHTLLISPRRYGKTSLVLRALELSKLPYAYIDLFLKYNQDSVLTELYSGIASLTAKLIKPTEVAIRKLETLLKNVSISLTLGKFGFEFNFSPKERLGQKNIKNLLIGIDELLAKNNKKAIIYIDEIQSIIDTEIENELESALRFVAQKTNHISFIFSGSNRHLVSKIFNDKSRPFYKLCHNLPLQRIDREHYIKFINNFAKKKWKHALSNETLDAIFYYTKFHPYYINILCAYLFEQTKLPTATDVEQNWHKICAEEQSSVSKAMEFLTQKQKQLLTEIAKNPGLIAPTAKDFLKKINLTPRGVTVALETLLKHDLIEKLETGEIRVIDPVLEYCLK